MAIRASGFTTFSIGPNQELTPEGFLLCKDVPAARTGIMLYGPDETPIASGKDGIVRIYREDEDVFNPKTIASAIGKPVTNDHPDDDVTPETWKKHAHGVALNVRRGEGALDDMLLMDLLITTEEGIFAIQNGKREISLGYDADYEELEEGKGRQSNIIVNHIALVEQGRCGSRCAIKDELPLKLEEMQMAASTRYGKKTVQNKKGLAKVMDLLFRANKAKDAEELNTIINEAVDDEDFMQEDIPGDGGDTHIHVHTNGEQVEESVPTEDDPNTEAEPEANVDPMQQCLDIIMARLDAIEAKIGGATDSAAEEETPAEESEEVLDAGEDLEEFLEEEAPEGTPSKDSRKALDSRFLGESMKDTIALAEILAPGIKMPTYDRMAKPGQTAKKICSLRRKAVDQALAMDTSSAMFADLTGGKKVDTSRMTCDAIRTLFRSAAAIKRLSNNSQGVRDSIQNLQAVKTHVKTLEEINAANKAFYASNK